SAKDAADYSGGAERVCLQLLLPAGSGAGRPAFRRGTAAPFHCRRCFVPGIAWLLAEHTLAHARRRERITPPLAGGSARGAQLVVVAPDHALSSLDLQLSVLCDDDERAHRAGDCAAATSPTHPLRPHCHCRRHREFARHGTLLALAAPHALW